MTEDWNEYKTLIEKAEDGTANYYTATAEFNTRKYESHTANPTETGYYYDKNIACLDEGQEYYCSETDSDGECDDWWYCEIGKSSGKSIIEMPNAEGACVGAGYELYCAVTNSDGACFKWSGCETGKSVPASGPNAIGTCN